MHEGERVRERKREKERERRRETIVQRKRRSKLEITRVVIRIV